MKKIMFNDKYGLTQAVLEGRKTQTRRIVPDLALADWETHDKYHNLPDAVGHRMDFEYFLSEYANYKVGEEIAVAQCYDDIYMEKNAPCPIPDEYRLNAYNKGFNQGHKGWKNKMFVLPDDMPFRIKITNVRVERLQDISDEDCLKEGISENAWEDYTCKGLGKWGYMTARALGIVHRKFFEETVFTTPGEAFATLIDKVSGFGTWDSNPMVFVYDFELIR